LSRWRIDQEGEEVFAFSDSLLEVLRCLRHGAKDLSMVFWASISPRGHSTNCIGDKMAAKFLIEMGGEVRRFETLNKLIAMAGLDPSIYQSSNITGTAGSPSGAKGISEADLAVDDPSDPVQ
jgi:hypothetical protein